MNLTEKEQEARKKVCLPLDGLDTLSEVKEMVEELSPVVGLFKVGKESYTRFGPEAVKLVQEYGANVFLDLKYHDIPNTVKGAAKAATALGVYMFNVHAAGGSEMMEAAKEGVEEEGRTLNMERADYPKITAVTVLTSLNDEILNGELNMPGPVTERVLSYAKLADQAGLDGIVCAGADLSAVRSKLPDDFMYVTPGIKGPNTSAGKDQKRVLTPGNAVEDGATILVIGRAITGAEDRVKAGYEVLQDIAKKL